MRKLAFALALAFLLLGCDKSKKNREVLESMAGGIHALEQSGVSCMQIVTGEGGPERGGTDVYGTPTRLDCAKNELCSAGRDRKHGTGDDQCVPVR